MLNVLLEWKYKIKWIKMNWKHHSLCELNLWITNLFRPPSQYIVGLNALLLDPQNTPSMEDFFNLLGNFEKKSKTLPPPFLSRNQKNKQNTFSKNVRLRPLPYHLSLRLCNRIETTYKVGTLQYMRTLLRHDVLWICLIISRIHKIR